MTDDVWRTKMRRVRKTVVAGAVFLLATAVPSWASSLVPWGDDVYGQVSKTPTGNGSVAISAGDFYNPALPSELPAGGEYLWGTVSNHDGQDYSIYVSSNGPDPTGQLLRQAIHGESVQRIRVLRGDGTPVSNIEAALEVVGIYQDYLWLKEYDYSTVEDRLVLFSEYGSNGSARTGDDNYFRFMLPYSPEQDNELNIILNTTSGLGNASVRRRLWKEVFYHNFLQRPIQKALDDVDIAQSGSELYPGRYPYWQKLGLQTTFQLEEIAEGGDTVANIAGMISKGQQAFLIAEVTDLDQGWLSIGDLQQLIETQKTYKNVSKYNEFLGQLEAKLALIDLGTSVATDVLNGLTNHAFAQGAAHTRSDAMAFVLSYGAQQEILNDTEILSGLSEAQAELVGDKEHVTTSILNEVAGGTLSSYDTYTDLLHVASHSAWITHSLPWLKTVAGKLGPALVVAQVTFGAAEEWDLIRHGSTGLVLQEYLRDSLRKYTTEELTQCDAEVVKKLRHAHECMIFSAFYYFDNLERVTNGKWYNPTDWIESILGWFSDYDAADDIADAGLARTLSKYAEFGPPHYAISGKEPWIRALLDTASAIRYVPSQYPTIQAAIDAASDGDTVLIADGIYTGEGNRNLTWDGNIKHITVKSENGPSNCVIDCENSGRGFNLDSAHQTSTDVIDGLTIIHGAGDGGGIFCEAASPSIRNCVFSNNNAGDTGAGGGILCATGAAPAIVDCQFTGNTAHTGAGIYCAGNSSPEILHCSITDNTALGGGGGIWCYDHCAAVISGCTITGNTAGSNVGGGIGCHYYSTPDISGCTITGNTASADVGGGIGCVTYAAPTIDQCTLSANSGEAGGGLGCDNHSSPTIRNCEINDNVAEQVGGGIFCLGSSSPVIEDCLLHHNRANGATSNGGGVCCSSSSSPTLTRCTITENSATVVGGGIACMFLSTPTITDCAIQGNTADTGGGIGVVANTSDLPGSSVTVVNSLISHNATVNDGGGVWVCWQSQVQLINCSILDNSADAGGGISCCGGRYEDEHASATVRNCVIWGNTTFHSTEPGAPQAVVHPHVGGATLTIAYTDVEGGLTQIGVEPGGTLIWDEQTNIAAEPLFVDPDGPDSDPATWQDNNYRFLSGSPCIDAADDSAVPSGITGDLDGHPRIQGAHVDMGAYEYQSSGLLHDWNGDGIVSIVGDVPPFVDCVYFQNCPGDIDPTAVGDCNGDGILSIVGDVPCFVECVYFGNCDE